MAELQPSHSGPPPQSAAQPAPRPLPWPLVALLVAALLGGFAETAWVVRREIHEVDVARNETPNELNLDWAYRSENKEALDRFRRLQETAKTGGVREFYWIYPEDRGMSPLSTQRYLAASLLYPRMMHRRVVKECPRTPGEPLSEVVDECKG